jgi:endonuclease-3
MTSKKTAKITEKTLNINKLLKEIFPEVSCELDFKDTYQVFVATMLSAQATDVSVNKVTPKLFKKFGSFNKLAKADVAEVEALIKSIGLFRNKAKNLVASAKVAVECFDGEVPDNIVDLLSFPGIGRKSAVVIMGNGFNIADGIAVDTHVKRIVHRLEIVDTKADTPEKIENQLMQQLPREEWTDFSHRMIFFGRRICSARSPKCKNCEMTDFCSYEFKNV